MNEAQLAKLIIEQINNSAVQFNISDLAIIIAIIVFAVINILKYWRNKDNNFDVNMANEAHEICTTKDEYKQPIILAWGKYAKEFTSAAQSINLKLEKLLNHQSERLDILEKKVADL